MKSFLFSCIIIILVGCSDKDNYKTAEQIYNSGEIDTAEFDLVSRNIAQGRDTLLYKHDGNLIVQRNYYGDNPHHLKCYAFYYKGKAEGKWIFYTESGEMDAIVNIKDGTQNGERLVFEDEKVLHKEFYKNGNLIYSIHYDSAGQILDSIGPNSK